MNIANKFDAEFRRLLLEKEFEGTTSEMWKTKALDALSHATPMGTGLTGTQFKSLVKSIESEAALNCYDFAIANNNLENISAHQLGMTLSGYCNLIEETGFLSLAWKAQTDGMRGELIRQLEIEDKAAALKSLQSGNGLKAIKSDA